MRICFTGTTNKNYVMVNTLILKNNKDESKPDIVIDRDLTEYTIEDGIIKMEWRGCYEWDGENPNYNIDYLDLDEYDRQVIGAILDSGYTDDYGEAKGIYDKGDFVFFPDVSNERDLAYAEIDEIGGVSELPIEKLETYIDEDEVYESWKDEISQEYMEDNNIDESELDESELDDYIWEVVRENIQNAIDDGDTDFMEQFFDYDYYGRDLSFDFTFTPYGAISIN